VRANFVGYQAGDGYDIWARLLAAHMGKYIPGNPTMIVQNMPGAGSMINQPREVVDRMKKLLAE
jgi:tripartite-type tricarboxylate transporter receptor subunit TctC